jgi:hypothetical protein
MVRQFEQHQPTESSGSLIAWPEQPDLARIGHSRNRGGKAVVQMPHLPASHE